MGKTPEQVRGVTVSPGQWGNGKDSSGVTGSDRIRDGIALPDETEMGSHLMGSLLMDSLWLRTQYVITFAGGS